MVSLLVSFAVNTACLPVQSSPSVWGFRSVANQANNHYPAHVQFAGVAENPHTRSICSRKPIWRIFVSLSTWPLLQLASIPPGRPNFVCPPRQLFRGRPFLAFLWVPHSISPHSGASLGKCASVYPRGTAPGD